MASSAPDRIPDRVRDRRLLAAGAGLLLLLVAAGIAIALQGPSSKPPATAKGTTHGAAAAVTAAPPASTAASGGTTTTANVQAQTTTQLARLESILTLAATGRQALANGDIAATVANRRLVLRDLRALPPDPELSASVHALQAAEGYSLHADTTCGLSCPSTVDARATALKRAFAATFNPVAAQHHLPTYSANQI